MTREFRMRKRKGRREELATLREALKAAGICFPFERDQQYPLSSLKDFEAMLATARKRDEVVSKALRDAATCWWVKLRNDELIPLEYFAANRRLPDDATFILMSQGSDVDIAISNDNAVTRLQITTTGPVWSRRDGSKRDWAYDQHLMMRKLNAENSVGGFGPFEETETRLPTDKMPSKQRRSSARLRRASRGRLRKRRACEPQTANC